MLNMKNFLLALFTVILLSWGCHNDDDTMVINGIFSVTIENVSTGKLFSNSGFFNTPVGASDPGAIGPGGAYEFDIKAGRGENLSFLTMFVESNDLFYAPDENGIPLYMADGTPISGDVTDQIQLWDAGTEVNEEPGVGPNQVIRQSGANTGTDENGTVREINQVADGYTYPATSEVIKVTVTPTSSANFTIRIENVSTGMTLSSSDGPKAVPLSPGAWVVHSSAAPLFTSGEADRDQGIEAIAEDGNPTELGDYIAMNSGIIYPLSPGAWAVHSDGKPFFTSGQPDYGEGLEAIAEDGAPGNLETSLGNRSEVESSGIFNTPEGASSPSAIGPGGKYTFTFTADDGDFLSFATMFVQSNDLFYSPDENGIALFNNGVPINGDITNQLSLYDAGTEVNEEPGFGPNQVIRQSGPNTGPVEGGNVRAVNDGFSYPALSDVIKVTILVQ